MRIARLDEMQRGWFVGNFLPTLYKTNNVEVAVKHYRLNEHEEWHYHRIATEITVIVSGAVEMNGERFESGDIIVLEPGDGSEFRTLLDTTTVVVKLPGVNNDKYLRSE